MTVVEQDVPIHTLIVGCGNILRGDDAVGPIAVRRMWEFGLPPGVRCADGGTGGMDVAFQMRGVPNVILIDACTSGAEPGATFLLPGAEVEQLPPLQGINLHAFRWDHALAFAHWLLKDDYPESVSVYLIEAAQFDPGQPLTPAVAAAMESLVERLLAETASEPPGHAARLAARHAADGVPDAPTEALPEDAAQAALAESPA